MSTTVKMPKDIPPQEQHRQPGLEKQLRRRPIYDDEQPGCGKLKDQVAVITGGDSGIGRAVAVKFAKEGADVVIAYLNEHEDAKETAAAVKKYEKDALLIAVDISTEEGCEKLVSAALARFKKIDILVNNAAVQYQQEEITNMSAQQLEYTFRVNIFSQFYLSKHTIPHLKEGSNIINTASVTAYKGNASLIDYSSTKGAIIAFTRSLSQAVAKKGIRVNAVAPGPVWTPLIPASYDENKVDEFGKNTVFGRPAQPVEIAGCYAFLASRDAGFITGQVLHPNGGAIVNA